MRGSRLEQWAHATGGFSSMYVFGADRKVTMTTGTDLLKDAMFVFEGDFTDTKDKMKIVDTVLGLWSLVLACKDDSFEVQLIYSRVHDDRERCAQPSFDRYTAVGTVA